MLDEKNVVLLAPYGAMKFIKLTAKISTTPPPPSTPPPGDGKTPLNF